MPSNREGSESLRPPSLLALPSYLAGSAAGIGNRRLVAVLRRDGLALQQYAVLVALQDFGELAPHELATRLHTDRSHISAAVETLLRKDLVLRVPHDKDRRRVTVSLTATGAELVTRVSATIMDSEQFMLSALSPPEQEMLRELLIKIIVSDESSPESATERDEGPAGGRKNSSQARLSGSPLAEERRT